MLIIGDFKSSNFVSVDFGRVTSGFCVSIDCAGVSCVQAERRTGEGEGEERQRSLTFEGHAIPYHKITEVSMIVAEW